MKLTGFLTDQDVNTIKLTTGTVVLEYDDATAGHKKPIHIDPRYAESFFELEGTNSSNYVLDKASLSGIRGDILPRPINIRFFTLCKEYDGSEIFDNAYLRYRICSAADSQSGLVTGTDSNSIRMCINKISIDTAGVNYVVGDKFIFTEFQRRGSSDESPLTICVSEVNADGAVTAISVPTDLDEYFSLYTFPITFEDSLFKLKVIDGDHMEQDLHINNPAAHNHGQLDKDDDLMPYNLVYINTADQYNDARRGFGIELEMELVSSDPNQVAVTNPPGKRFVASDVGKVLLSVDCARLSSKNATTHSSSLKFDNYKLHGEACNNYILNDLVGLGYIYKRRTEVEVSYHDKVYDGTAEMNMNQYRITRKLDTDDILISNGNDLYRWESKNVGSKAHPVHVPVLDGVDANNYYVHDYAKLLNSPQITRRPISCSLDEIRVCRADGRYFITYNLDNTLSGDDVWLDFTAVSIQISSGEHIEGLFTSDTHTNTDSNLNDILNIIQNENIVSVSNLSLKGSDANNYELTNTVVDNVPIRVINIY